jgi:hypothetical protein
MGLPSSTAANEPARMTRCAQLLARIAASASDASLLAEVLSLPRDRYPALDLTPQQCRQRTLEAFTRQVELLGDGVLVYFGYPRAHEDSAERAVGRPRSRRGRAEACDRRRRAAPGARRDRHRHGRGW